MAAIGRKLHFREAGDVTDKYVPYVKNLPSNKK